MKDAILRLLISQATCDGVLRRPLSIDKDLLAFVYPVHTQQYSDFLNILKDAFANASPVDEQCAYVGSQVYKLTGKLAMSRNNQERFRTQRNQAFVDSHTLRKEIQNLKRTQPNSVESTSVEDAGANEYKMLKRDYKRALAREQKLMDKLDAQNRELGKQDCIIEDLERKAKRQRLLSG